MNTYLIGDIHGCYDEFSALLKQVNFNPLQDNLWITGDLIGRGPDSLKVLHYVKSLGKSVRLVLGNHDLNLLAIYAGINRNQPKYRLTTLLKSKHADELINWLRHQPLLQIDENKKLLMTHAGITPQWDLETAKMYARKIEKLLSNDAYKIFLKIIYGNNKTNNWNPTVMKEAERLCFSFNTLTRMRFCLPNGQLNMVYNKSPDSVPSPLKPWFAVRGKIDKTYTIVFGHWAALEGKYTPNNVIALDTGCCWGGKLTLLHWETQKYYMQRSYPR